MHDKPSAVKILGGSLAQSETHFLPSAVFIIPPSAYPMHDVTQPSPLLRKYPE